MPAQRHQKHTIDFLFPAALFLVFAVSALCVMLLAAGIYRQSAVETAKNDVSRTALSYISEKIHQGDSGDAVHLGTFDGLDALAIQQTVGDDSYTTYIYLYEKELKELFIKDDVQARASAGKTILSISDFSMEELKNVTAEQALAHPTWKMGKKITIDSATLMNKGFEIIEAVRLFGFPEDKVAVVVHPQSIIHSMVEYNDNTVTAQIGKPDMRDCIRYAATAPHSAKIAGDELDFAKLSRLTFFEPDDVKFPLMNAARAMIRKGGTAPASLIAADEEAVDEFLRGGIGFTDISSVVLETLGKISVSFNISTDNIMAAVDEARLKCRETIGNYVKQRV